MFLGIMIAFMFWGFMALINNVESTSIGGRWIRVIGQFFFYVGAFGVIGWITEFLLISTFLSVITGLPIE